MYATWMQLYINLDETKMNLDAIQIQLRCKLDELRYNLDDLRHNFDATFMQPRCNLYELRFN